MFELSAQPLSATNAAISADGSVLIGWSLASPSPISTTRHSETLYLTP
jgi:hypothetical protein